MFQAPYASMVTIEVYAGGTVEVEDYFRIVYNGVAQTLPSCGNKSLCEIRHLLDAMDFGVTECPIHDFDISTQEDSDNIIFDSDDYPIILFLTLLLGILMGATIMRTQMEKQNNPQSRQNFQLLSDQSSHGSFTSSTSSSSLHHQRGNNEDSEEDEIYVNTTQRPTTRSQMRFSGGYESEMVDFRI